ERYDGKEWNISFRNSQDFKRFTKNL
ncbi:uncharacterized protein METZ01_LOCUS399599, partial [marine metagenome]